MRTSGENGAVAVEFVVLIPAVLLLGWLLIAGGRIWLAQGELEQAAGAAARAASLSRTPAAAYQSAQAFAAAQLATGELPCREVRIEVEAGDLDLPPGNPGQVSARLTCVLDLGFPVPGWPDTLSLAAGAWVGLDRYRGRG